MKYLIATIGGIAGGRAINFFELDVKSALAGAIIIGITLLFITAIDQ